MDVVAVDRAQIRADWRAREREHARVLVDYDASPQVQMDLVRAVRVVVDRLNERCEALGRQGRPRFWGEVAYLTARGASLYVNTRKAEGLERFLDELVIELAQLVGFDQDARLSSPEEYAETPAITEPVVGLFGVLALSGWGTTWNGSAVLAWRRGPDLAPDLAALVFGWLGQIEGVTFLPHGSLDEIPADRVEAMVRLMLADFDRLSLKQATRSGGQVARRVNLTRRGDLILYARVRVAEVDRVRAELVTLLREWAPRCDFTAILLGHPMGAGELKHAVQWSRERPVPMYWAGDRDLDREYLPTAFGWQTVTRTHLDRAHDLSRWHVEQLAQDCYQLEPPEPEQWFRSQDDTRSKVDPGALEHAYRDFGDLILGGEWRDILENRT